MLERAGFANMPVPKEGEKKSAYDKRVEAWKASQRAVTERMAKYDARTGEGGGGVKAAEAAEHGLGMAYDDAEAREAWVKDKTQGNFDSKFAAIKALTDERKGLQEELAKIAQDEKKGKILKGINQNHGMGTDVVNPVRLQLEGVEFLHQGIVTSTHDMVTEITYQFIARDYYELFLANEDPMSQFPAIQQVLQEFAHTEDVNIGFDRGGNLKSQYVRGFEHPITGISQTQIEVAPDMDGYQMTATAGPDGNLVFPEGDINDKITTGEMRVPGSDAPSVIPGRIEQQRTATQNYLNAIPIDRDLQEQVWENEFGGEVGAGPKIPW